MRVTLQSGGGARKDIATLVRAADADSLVVVVLSSDDALDLAMTRAVIGPLAIERAPGCRVNAVFPGTDTAESVIDAAVWFLEKAVSTTGQCLDLD